MPLVCFQVLPAPTAVSVVTTLLTSNIKGELSVCVKVLAAQLCLTLCDPMDCSMPGLPVHHQHLEPTQTHVH